MHYSGRDTSYPHQRDAAASYTSEEGSTVIVVPDPTLAEQLMMLLEMLASAHHENIKAECGNVDIVIPEEPIEA